MLERGISREAVKAVLLLEEVIEDYPEDNPFPGALFFGLPDEKPLHVVAADEAVVKRCFIITVYRPDLEHFEPDYKTRRKDGS